MSAFVSRKDLRPSHFRHVAEVPISFNCGGYHQKSYGHQELDSPLGDGMRAMVGASSASRLGTPDDIAAVAAFLLGPESSFVTGTDILVDGGVNAALRSAYI